MYGKLRGHKSHKILKFITKNVITFNNRFTGCVRVY